MQTFLPYKDFKQSAEVLDYRRLGKQRVEAWQIYQTLRHGSRWQNHPAVKMWKGHELALLEYAEQICLEWRSRGYVDNMLEKISQEYDKINKTENCLLPKWLGLEAFHASHRSNLLRKDFDFYSKYQWKEPTTLEYVWP